MVTVSALVVLLAAAESEPVGTTEPAPEATAAEAATEAVAEETAAEAVPADEDAEQEAGAEAPVEEPEEAAVVAPDAGSGELQERIKRSRRKRVDSILDQPGRAGYGDPGVAPGDRTFVGEERPAFLRPRWPGGALALGAFVGFGAGYYYAGVPRWGLTFSLVDVALISGFVASTVVFNNLVIEHDFNQGVSLARDERDFTAREQRWYTASVIFALAEVASRAFQAFGSLRAARRTNASLESFSFVPLGDGAALQIGWPL